MECDLYILETGSRVAGPTFALEGFPEMNDVITIWLLQLTPPAKLKSANYKFIFRAAALQVTGGVNHGKANKVTESFPGWHAL